MLLSKARQSSKPCTARIRYLCPFFLPIGAELTTATAKTIQIYLPTGEWYCMQQAKQVGRYELDNGQVPPNPTHVTEPMVAELRDIFDTMRMLVSTLGYPVFEPIVKPSTPSHLFYARGGGSDGKGELVEDGFVVHEGSRARTEVAPSAMSSVKPQRDKLVVSGVMEERSGEYVFTQDYLFSSPSTAAAVVLGRSANGWVEWKDEHGQTLSDVYRAPAESNEPEANG